MPEKLYFRIVRFCGGRSLAAYRGNDPEDLTQELFLRLWEKNRFAYYLESGMSNAEIEGQIAHCELKNLLTAKLRRSRPESYRIARRISDLVAHSSEFKHFDRYGSRARRHKVYGLSTWNEDKGRLSFEEVESRVCQMPILLRDNSPAGCCRDSSVIVTGQALKDLIRRVFERADTPLSISELRALVSSRLYLLDAFFMPTAFSYFDEDAEEVDFPDSRENGEQRVIRRESEKQTVENADSFINELNRAVHKKNKQFRRILQILQDYYLTAKVNQKELAAAIGVSDSLVSDYRRRIEKCLGSIMFSGIDDAALFEDALRRKVGAILSTE